MRVERCDPTGPDVTVTCARCGDRLSIRQAAADLEGPAFEAYYCADCLLRWSAELDGSPRESAQGLRLHDVAEAILGGSEAAARRWVELVQAEARVDQATRGTRMREESSILYETPDATHWVRSTPKGYEVYRSGVTHSVRVASIGHGPGPHLGLDRAIEEADKRVKES